MIKFSKVLIIFLVVVSNMVLAGNYGPANMCANGVDVKLEESIRALTQFTSCSEIKKETERCNCIQKTISGKQTEADFGSLNLITKVNESYEKLEQEGDKAKKKYYQQYSEVYKMMTSHSTIQKTVLGLETDPASVGCTPVEMSKGIKLKMDESIKTQVSALSGMQEAAKAEFSKCEKAGGGESCYIHNNKAELLGKRIESMKGFKNAKSADNCSIALNVLGDKDSILSMQKYMNNLNKRSYKKSYDAEGKSNSGHREIISTVDELNGLIDSNSNMDINAFLKKHGMSCSDFMIKFENVTSAYKDEFTKNIQGGAAIATDLDKYSPKEQCPDNDPICVAYALKNLQLMITNAELHSPSPQDEDSCLTYAEFVTYEGRPSKRLLREFASSDHPEKLLENTAGFLGHGRDDDKKAFLRANPLIMQLAQMKDKGVDGSPSPADQLGKLLKKMAKDIKGNRKEGATGRFSRYLDLMKGDGGLKDIMKSSGALAVKKTCDDLEKTFTAISLSNEFVKVNTENMDRREEENFNCVASIYENTNSSKLDDSLKESPLYKFGEKPDGMPTQKAYEKFKKEECPRIAAFKEQGCLLKDSKRCNQNNPKIKAIQNNIKEHGINRSLSPEKLAKANSNLDRKSQDPVFDETYDREVTSKLNHNALATVDDKGEFHASMVSNQQIQNQNNVMELYNKEKSGFTPSNSLANNTTPQAVGPSSSVDGFEQNKENPGQVRPVFESPAPVSQPPIADFDKFSSKQISEATQIRDLDPSFNERPYEEKLSTYKALKDYVSEGGTPPQFSPSEEIKELEKSVEESKVALRDLEKDQEEDEKKGAKVAQAQTSSSAASRAPANFQQASFVAPISNAPVLGQFPGSRAVVGSEAKLSKAEASYQAALMQKYKMNQNLQILIQGQDAVVKAPYDIKASNVLKADDVYPFSKLSDPNKLSEFLAVKIGQNVADGESIKIMDPASNNYFLLKATVKDGITSYQRYPFVDEKDIRIVKLGDLHNTLKLNK